MKKIFLFIIFLSIVFGLNFYLFKTKQLHWDEWFAMVQNKFYQLQNIFSNSSDASHVETITFTSFSLNDRNKEIKVYLPKAYDENENQRFPVLYLLHGFPGNNMDWLINANLQKQLDDLINEQKLPPLIVVFPDGNGPVIRDSQYVDATLIDQKMESYILELVKKIDDSYRTLNQRQNRAIGGMSSGAYGAVNIGLRHNDLFGIMISHSGYFFNQEKVLKKLLSEDQSVLDANNPMIYIDNLDFNPDTKIYMDIGKNDDHPSFLEQNKEFDQKLTDRNLSHEFKITDGWHNWNVWRSNINSSLLYLGKIWK